jgi:ribosomal protein L29
MANKSVKEDYKSFSVEALEQKASELKQVLGKERAVIASGTRSENPGKIRKTRREIARILTFMTMKNKEAAIANAKKVVTKKVVAKETKSEKIVAKKRGLN